MSKRRQALESLDIKDGDDAVLRYMKDVNGAGVPMSYLHYIAQGNINRGEFAQWEIRCVSPARQKTTVLTSRVVINPHANKWSDHSKLREEKSTMVRQATAPIAGIRDDTFPQQVADYINGLVDEVLRASAG